MLGQELIFFILIVAVHLFMIWSNKQVKKSYDKNIKMLEELLDAEMQANKKLTDQILKITIGSSIKDIMRQSNKPH